MFIHGVSVSYDLKADGTKTLTGSEGKKACKSMKFIQRKLNLAHLVKTQLNSQLVNLNVDLVI